MTCPRTNPRILASTVFAALLLTAFFVTGSGAQPNTIRKIANGVWFREGDTSQGLSNNVIIEMKDYLIVVDANFPAGARLTLADARKLSPKPVKYVFITHHHGDHEYGSPIWTAEGAVTFAYKGVVDELNLYEPARWLEAADARRDVAELHRNGPEYPKQTFEKSPYIMKDSTREVRFLFLGWAHTRGDGLVWLPKERILCTGDVATNGPYNNTNDANIGNWPKVLAAAENLKPRFVLPGHGPAGGPEILTGQASFLEELLSAAQQAYAAGKTLGDIVTLSNGKPVDTSITLSSRAQHWVGKSLPTHVANAYSEVANGQPVGALPHP
ncbi:MAG: MBL fold metallo-hydrolase [Acidobacteriota bacterium]|nr:MBL fold metallo-hydrolase [Acidobacteriota bacterium]